jgi:hypothetical protein
MLPLSVGWLSLTVKQESACVSSTRKRASSTCVWSASAVTQRPVNGSGASSFQASGISLGLAAHIDLRHGRAGGLRDG